MNNQVDDRLTVAFELIERGEREQARGILDEVLQQHSGNADAWWLYANAVDEPQVAHMALSQLVRIDPEYPGAQDLLQMIDDGNLTNGDAPSVTNATDNPDDFDDLMDGLDDDDAPQGEKRGGRLLQRLIPLLIVLVLVFVGVWILTSGGNQSDDSEDTPTQVAGASVVDPLPTEVPTVAAQSANSSSAEQRAALPDVLQEFEAVDSGAPVIETTTLGMTELISICTTSESFRDDLSEVIDIVASALDPQLIQGDAVGVIFVDCEGNIQLNALGVGKGDLESYIDGNITLDRFRGTWRVITVSSSS